MPFLLAMAAVGWAASVAPAGFIVRNGTSDQNGTGFGNVLNLLTVQQNGSEFGSVLWNGSADVETDNAKNTSATRTVAELLAVGVSATSDNLSLIFNISQEGGDPTLVLRAFTLRFQDAAGATLFSDITWDPASASDNPGGSNPQTLAMIGNGSGSAGHVFNVTLSASERATFFSSNTNRIGMIITSANAITNANDGQENFYLARDSRLVPTPVPVPPSVLLLGAGVASLGLVRLVNLRKWALVA